MGMSELAGMIPSIAVPLAAHLDGFARWAAPAAVDGLWQGGAVAAGLAICLRLAPRVSAAHRFAAWIAGFGVAAGLPALPYLAHLVTGFAGGAVDGSATVVGGAAHAWLQFDARWSVAIAAVWLAISAYRVAGLTVHIARLRGLWKSARPVVDGFVSKTVFAFTNGRKFEICATQELDRPSVIGFFAPRILIPERLLERLTREELEQVILHEAEHLRRGDDWTNFIQKVFLAVFPLNPALVWMDRRLAKEREMACDEGVVRVTRAPRAYAACLASLAERGLENRAARAEALSLGAFERRPELVHRVHSLLRGGHKLSPVAGWSVVGVVGCGLICGAVELARCPQVVAFVPQSSAPAMAAAEAPYAMRDVSALVRAEEGFRAVNAEAIVPAKRMALTRSAKGAGSADSVVTASAGHGAMGAVNVKAAVPVSHAARAAQSQELLVVTWQTQTTFRAQNVADYDDGGNNEPNGMANPSQGSRPANEMAVTKMFLGVYRASETAKAAGQSTNERSTRTAGDTARPTAAAMDLKTLENRQTAVPFGDGWLVIQL